jgi:zinc transporter
MSEQFGLIAAWVLDGKGGGRELDWAGLRAYRPEDGPLWLHLNRTMTQAQTWLAMEAGLDEVVAEALLDNETRPRCATIGSGVLINLRGIDRNPGADPDDLASLRIWVENGRAISARRVPITAVSRLFDQLAKGKGPCNLGEFVVAVAEHIADDIEPDVLKLGEAVDEIEEKALTHRDEGCMERLGEVRQRVNGLRRYMVPQRQALDRLTALKFDWLGDAERRLLHEVTEQTARFVEDLDSVRDRALVVTDLLEHRLGLKLNRVMYMLSVIATLFLPLTFLASLMGMNVGGIPGQGAWGFVAVSAVMGLVLTALVFLFKRLRWI